MFKKAQSFVKNYLLQRKAYQFFIRDWITLSDLQGANDMLATMRFSQNLQPLQRSAPDADRILVIAPHPDDESIGPGGTLLKALKKKVNLLVLYLTCGTSENSNLLQSEAFRIASAYRYDSVFLNYHSKNIPVNNEALLQFSKIINDFSPEVVFLPFLLDDHDDHRRASHLLFLAQSKRFLQCNFVVWAYQVYTTLLPNVIVDITDIILEKKQWIKMWTIQNKTRNWAHFTLGLNAFNQRFLLNSAEAKYAEGFFVLPLKEYLNYCRLYFKRPEACYYHSNYKHQKYLISN